MKKYRAIESIATWMTKLYKLRRKGVSDVPYDLNQYLYGWSNDKFRRKDVLDVLYD